jgi:putative addiction module CopG family antidote
MTIHLPEDLEHFLQSQVESGAFASQDEAIAEAVRRLKLGEQQQAPETSAKATSAPADPI